LRVVKDSKEEIVLDKKETLAEGFAAYKSKQSPLPLPPLQSPSATSAIFPQQNSNLRKRAIHFLHVSKIFAEGFYGFTKASPLYGQDMHSVVQPHWLLEFKDHFPQISH